MLVRFYEIAKASKMFKKTLLAAAIATLSAGATAVDVSTSSKYTYGSEALSNGFLKNDFTAVQLNQVILDLGTGYAAGDIIKITLTGATFKTDESYALGTSDANVIEADFLSATANQLVFRVTKATGNTANETLTLAAGSKIKLDSIAVGATVTVAAAAQSSTGVAIDVTGTTDSLIVGTVIQQHKFDVTTPLVQKIDISKERKALTAASDTATITYIHVTPTFAASNFDITFNKGLTLTAKGSFTGFETGLTTSTNLGTVTLDGEAALIAADLQSGAAAIARPALNDILRVVFTPDAAAATRVVLSTGAYTVSAAITDGTYTTTYTGLALGSFGLNTLKGANAQFGYVPVNFAGAVTSQFEVGNKGVVDGEITLSAFDTAGNDYSAVLPFAAQAGKLTNIGDDDIAKAFGLTKGTKLNLTIAINAPLSDITFGGYSNRGTTGRMSLQPSLLNGTETTGRFATSRIATGPCQGQPEEFTFYGLTYKHVVSNGKCWLDRNLGASQVATSSTDTASSGDLYQWGRGKDGHELRTSVAISTQSSSDTPGNGNFIAIGAPQYDWRSSPNNNLWQGVNGINNPCPSGYRVPTGTELFAEFASFSPNNTAGAFASPLKLPFTGRRNYNGIIDSEASYGFYWASTVVGSTNYPGTILANYIFFRNQGSFAGSYRKARALAVRCIKD
jgi:hypothetical protein